MPIENKDVDKLFEMMSKHDASDLHLKAGASPILRIHGSIREVDAKPLKARDLQSILFSMLDADQRQRFDKNGDIDFAHGIPGLGRFRINGFRQRGSISIAARRVNVSIPSFQELHLPVESLRRIASLKQGLVLVAGATGSGKSTTLASIIETINSHRRCHVVTIEDPIEYLFTDKKSFINQREVGIDVKDFDSALKTVVRQDPDIILIGEMRDAETFFTALTAAETGHLVLSTIHSSSVPQTIGRILDLFPSDQHDQIRKGLVFNLKAVLCQKILPSIHESSARIPATEILFSTPSVQKLIAKKLDEKLSDAVRTGTEDGMMDFNQSIFKLVQDGYISKKIALSNSPNPDQLKMNLQGIFLDDQRRILGS
ncbi:MAG: PilT/PilU family type 4a pilus ATPase [Planctomycetota bacterium]|jgi:twitching motility protein PilT|nr:PilT/PilU family type 4a pilus ATPase [Planctomycetota bacterium]